MAVSDYWVDYLKGMSPVRPWDKLILGQYTWPGILAQFTPDVDLSIDANKVMTKFDPKNGPAYKVRLIDRGYNPARIRAVLQIFTVDDWADLKSLLPKFTPKQQSVYRDAWDISHPSCNLLGIKSVVVTRIGVPQPINQTLFLELDLMEWYPSTPWKLSRSTGAAIVDLKIDGVNPPP